tara:strand:- start:659 stop:847 length:189 start_codon:yes stop_codon:yes gene_type:complete
LNVLCSAPKSVTHSVTGLDFGGIDSVNYMSHGRDHAIDIKCVNSGYANPGGGDLTLKHGDLE